VADRSGLSDTLTLRPDGRYIHTTVFAGGRVLVDSGAWRPTTIAGQGRLQIDHWVLWEAPDSQQLIPGADAGTWYARVDTLPDGTLSLPLGAGMAFTAIR
jgi:hypothetical protein